VLEKIDYSKGDLLPAHMRESVQAWIEKARPPGSFLAAVIQNNLREAFARADSVNARKLDDIVRWFYNNAPSWCWGSPEAMASWPARLEGLREKDQQAQETKGDGNGSAGKPLR